MASGRRRRAAYPEAGEPIGPRARRERCARRAPRARRERRARRAPRARRASRARRAPRAPPGGSIAVTLVTGGARSGKSRHAEHLLRAAARPLGAPGRVTYVATGPSDDGSDAEWSARVTAHRLRRPPTWRSVETLDLVGALEAADGPVLVECLGTWLTGLVDQAGFWDALDAAADLVSARRSSLCATLRRASVDVVLVTNEVGLCLVPQTPSGRFFQDQLGLLNAAVAAVADHVHLVVAGRVLDLTAAPVVP